MSRIRDDHKSLGIFDARHPVQQIPFETISPDTGQHHIKDPGQDKDLSGHIMNDMQKEQEAQIDHHLIPG